MTVGYSSLVVTVLSQIPKDVKFEVIVTEHQPTMSGTEMINVCSKHGIQSTMISDDSVFAAMR